MRNFETSSLGGPSCAALLDDVVGCPDHCPCAIGTRCDGRWRLELWVRNIPNNFYWTSVQHIEDTVTRLAGMPSAYSVTAR